MTPSEAINRLYNWAFHHANDPKAGFQVSFCAKEVVTIIENRQTDEEAVEAIRALSRDWIKAKRPGFGEPIKAVVNVLALIDQQQQTAAQ